MIFGSSLCLGLILSYLIIKKGGLAEDRPNTRSSHTKVTPRGGGLAFSISTFIVFSCWHYLFGKPGEWGDLYTLLCIAIGFAILGAAEDRSHVSVKLRFFFEGSLALLLISAGYRWNSLDFNLFSYIMSTPLSFFMTVVWCVWVANLYNFMDGINGIATLVGIVWSLFYFAFASFHGWYELQVLSLALCGSLLAFLPFNSPRSKIFMGDTGSLFLGSMFAFIPLYIHSKDGGKLSTFAATSFMAPFFFDATFTVLRRLFLRENIFQPHRYHYFQRLTDLLQSHTKTALIYTSISSLFCFLIYSIYVGSTDPLFPKKAVPIWIALFSLVGFFMVIHWKHLRLLKKKS